MPSIIESSPSIYKIAGEVQTLRADQERRRRSLPKKLTSSKHRTPYPSKLREQMVEMVFSGQTARHLAEQYAPSAATISKWARTAWQEKLIKDIYQEWVRLRTEVLQIKKERNKLARAVACFARKTE